MRNPSHKQIAACGFRQLSVATSRHAMRIDYSYLLVYSNSISSKPRQTVFTVNFDGSFQRLQRDNKDLLLRVVAMDEVEDDNHWNGYPSVNCTQSNATVDFHDGFGEYATRDMSTKDGSYSFWTLISIILFIVLFLPLLSWITRAKSLSVRPWASDGDTVVGMEDERGDNEDDDADEILCGLQDEEMGFPE